MNPFLTSLYPMFDAFGELSRAVGRSMFNIRLFLLSCLWLLASPTLKAISDSNGNGVSDIWEKHYNNGNLLTAFDPTADPDGDGWTNEQEAVTGTDPDDANPPDGFVRPEIDHIPAVYGSPEEEGGPPVLVSPETSSIRWPTLAGKQYTLFSSADLSPGSWRQVGESRIGSGSTLGADIPLTQPDGSILERLFQRVSVHDVDTDGDTLTNAEEHSLGSSIFLADTNNDKFSDAGAVAIGNNPAAASPDADNNGVPDNELYSVVFEVQGETHGLDDYTGFEAFVGSGDLHRYLTYVDSEEYSVTNSPKYAAITDGEYAFTSSYLDGNALSTVEPLVYSEEGTRFDEWRTANTLTLAEGEYIDYEDMETTGDVHPPTATELSFTTTETTPWRVRKPVVGNPNDITVRSGTEVIVVTERYKLEDSVTYQDLWNNYVKPGAWHSETPQEWGPLNSMDYVRAVAGDSQAAESIRDQFSNGDFGILGSIAAPGKWATILDAYDNRLKRVRWRWVRFNPLEPFEYEYVAPPATYRKTFHLLVTQHDFSGTLPWHFLNNPATVDETKAKGIIGIDCVGNQGATSSWQEVPLEKFNGHKLEDPAGFANLNFGKFGESVVGFSNRPFGILAHKRGTVAAPGPVMPSGGGEFGYETVMMENSDSESAANSSERDCVVSGTSENLSAYRMAEDDDLVKIILQFPAGAKIAGNSLSLAHEGMQVDATKLTPEEAVSGGGASRLNFYKNDGTRITDPVTQFTIPDLANPPANVLLSDLVTNGNLTLFVEGADRFGDLPENRMDRLGGARLRLELKQGETVIVSAKLLIYRGGFLRFMQPSGAPGTAGDFEFWDGKGRVKNKVGTPIFGKEFETDVTHYGTKLATWKAKSGKTTGEAYNREDKNGHTPPGWWSYFEKEITSAQDDQTSGSGNNKKIEQGGYVRWKQDDETDAAQRYTNPYNYDGSKAHDRAIGEPTKITFKYEMVPIPKTEAQTRSYIQIHPDGDKNGTAGCIGIQTFSDCKQVSTILERYTNLKVKVQL